ncbi:hypothetical protein [Candidatus Poriferisodalis sp.]|uniref:hypothetical protein n=1 Tax=Candidatus Poriferisodalis sp. TaxID=3101277 RepID=UPI003B52F2C9
MSTITEMTDEHAPAAVPVPAAASGPGEGTAAGAKRDRALVIPVPTAITAALVAGLFGLLFVSLNGLGNDIEGLRGEIGSLRSDVDARFREVNTILLDHTDWLARIETHLDIRPPSDTQAPEAQP